MMGFGLVDGIVPEPFGGAHWDYDEAASNLKKKLIPVIRELKQLQPEDRVNGRIKKFGAMGFWDED